MIATLKEYDVKGYLLGSVVLGSPEDHFQGYFFTALSLFARYYSFEGGLALFDARFIGLHLV